MMIKRILQAKTRKAERWKIKETLEQKGPPIHIDMSSMPDLYAFLSAPVVPFLTFQCGASPAPTDFWQVSTPPPFQLSLSPADFATRSWHGLPPPWCEYSLHCALFHPMRYQTQL